MLRWYGARAVSRRTAARVILPVAGALVLAGCGGTRQDVHEPNATFPVSIVRASFPGYQTLADRSELVVAVKNIGSQTLPNVAVTIKGFNYYDPQEDLADHSRPVWIVDFGPGPHAIVQGEGALSPGGYVTADPSTWAAGPLPAGHTATFIWRVTSVRAGLHRLDWIVAAGLYGKAKARLADGAIPQGRFRVLVTTRPAQSHVDPSTGQVVPGPYPVAPGP